MHALISQTIVKIYIDRYSKSPLDVRHRTHVHQRKRERFGKEIVTLEISSSPELAGGATQIDVEETKTKT